MKYRGLLNLLKAWDDEGLDDADVVVMINGKLITVDKLTYSYCKGWYFEIPKQVKTSQYTLVETYAGVTDSITSFPTLEKAKDAMNELVEFNENNDDVAIWHDGSVVHRKTDPGIWVDQAEFGTYMLHSSDGDILVQTDLERPGLAMNLGWKPCHPETDGTVDCPVCGKTAGDLIEEATEFLDAHLGEKFDDPGYFDQEDEK